MRTLLVRGMIALVVLAGGTGLAAAEVRTIQETVDKPGKTWEESITVQAEANGGWTETRRFLGQIRVSRFNASGQMVLFTVSKKGFTFQAERNGSKVSYSATGPDGNRTGTVDLDGKDWFDTWEQAGQFLLKHKKSKLPVILLSEAMPDRPIVFEVSNDGLTSRKGTSVVSFSVSATGMAGLLMPQLHFWLQPQGRLVAQEILPLPESRPGPGGPPPGSGQEPPELKLVLQEVVAVKP